MNDTSIDIADSYHHRGGDVPLLGKTIPQHFSEIVARFPNQDAVVSRHQKKRLTYRELEAETAKVAKSLSVMGFEKGDRIGIWSTDNIEWLLLQLATALIGAVLVNINPAYRPRELDHVLKTSELQGLFTIPSFKTSNYVEMLIELVPELSTGSSEIESVTYPNLRRVILYDPQEPMQTHVQHPGFIAWQDFLTGGEILDNEELLRQTQSLDRDDPINIQYTSGTTGFPKAVLLSHHNILNNAYFTALQMRFTETDRLCVPVPFYHCFGMVLSNLLCISVGACLVIPAEHFDPLEVLIAIEKEKCTALHGVPTMFIAELEHPEFHNFDLSTLRTGIMAGAPCPPELMKRVINDMHCRQILIAMVRLRRPQSHI